MQNLGILGNFAEKGLKIDIFGPATSLFWYKNLIHFVNFRPNCLKFGREHLSKVFYKHYAAFLKILIFRGNLGKKNAKNERNRAKFGLWTSKFSRKLKIFEDAA